MEQIKQEFDRRLEDIQQNIAQIATKLSVLDAQIDKASAAYEQTDPLWSFFIHWRLPKLIRLRMLYYASALRLNRYIGNWITLCNARFDALDAMIKAVGTNEADEQQDKSAAH